MAGGVWSLHLAPGQAPWDSCSRHRLLRAVAVSLLSALGVLGAACVQLSCAPVVV